MKYFKYIVIIFLAFLFIYQTSFNYSAEEQQAREWLAKQGVPYTQERFVDAVVNNEVQVVEKFLQAGMDPDTQAQIGTAFGWAVANTHQEVIKLLIQYGGGSDYEEIFKAAIIGDLSYIKKFVKENPHNKEDLSYALHSASEQGHAAVVSYLLEVGANPYVGQGAMHFAVKNEQWEVVKVLIKAGVKSPKYTLSDAASDGHFELVKTFIESGTKPTTRDVISADSVEILKYLLDHGADPNKEYLRLTPLAHYADDGGDPIPFLELLLNYGASIDKQGKWGHTPLMEAARYDRTETVKYFLEHGANINKQEKKGQTALMVAARFNCTETVKFLLKHGADPNIISEEGKTAYDYAMENEGIHGYYSTVKVILQYGGKSGTEVDEEK